MESIHYDVIVLGAGAAGLSAAQKLKELNIEYLILEARNRIGGRTFTDYDFTNYPIELGAEFIHGSNVTTHELCEKYNIKTKEIVRMPNLYYTTDSSSPATFYKNLPKEQLEIVEKTLEIEEKMSDFDFEEDISVGTFVKQFTDDKKILETSEVLLCQTCCNSIDGLSCYDVKTYLTVHDEHEGESKLLDGYTQLINHLAKDCNIKLNSVVEKIEWSDKEAIIYVRDEVNNTILKYFCKKCVISLPVSILQSDVKFSPNLPKFKQEAIDAFEFHPGTKIIYQFEKLLWDPKITYLCHPGVTGRWWIQSHGKFINFKERI
jgi:monoamine oxidase